MEINRSDTIGENIHYRPTCSLLFASISCIQFLWRSIASFCVLFLKYYVLYFQSALKNIIGRPEKLTSQFIACLFAYRWTFVLLNVAQSELWFSCTQRESGERTSKWGNACTSVVCFNIVACTKVQNSTASIRFSCCDSTHCSLTYGITILLQTKATSLSLFLPLPLPLSPSLSASLLTSHTYCVTFLEVWYTFI